MPRDRLHAAGVHAVPVLQRVGQLDAAEQVEAGLDRRGRHLRRNDPGVDRGVRVVLHRERHDDQRPVFEHDVPQRRVDDLGQRQPAAAIRRVLHPDGRVGNPEPASKGDGGTQAGFPETLPRVGTAGRSVPAPTRQDLLRVVHDRQRDLPLGGGVFDHVVRDQSPGALRAAVDRPHRRGVGFRGAGRPTGHSDVEVLSDPGEVVQGEEETVVDHAGGRGQFDRRVLLRAAAVQRRLRVRDPAQPGRRGLRRDAGAVGVGRDARHVRPRGRCGGGTEEPGSGPTTVRSEGARSRRRDPVEEHFVAGPQRQRGEDSKADAGRIVAFDPRSDRGTAGGT